MANLDKATVKNISDDLINMAKTISEKYGVDFSFAGGSFDSVQATIKIKVKAKDSENEVSSDQKIYNHYSKIYNLRPEWFGKNMTINGKVYEICGISTSSYKYPVLAKRNGKIFKFTTECVIKAFVA
jgi:hypothetical protein